jgi:hypothetical protein
VLDPLNLISNRQDRLEERIKEVESEVDEIPVLRKEVALLTKAVDRNTNALYTVVGTVVATGVVGVLLQRGLIG